MVSITGHNPPKLQIQVTNLSLHINAPNLPFEGVFFSPFHLFILVRKPHQASPKTAVFDQTNNLPACSPTLRLRSLIREINAYRK